MLALGTLLALGWVWLLGQNALLWQRLPIAAADRYIGDRIAAPLPARPTLEAFEPLCAAAERSEPAWKISRRQALARCLAGARSLAPAPASAGLAAHYETQVHTQLQAAEAWLAEHERRAANLRDEARRELDAARTAEAPWIRRLAAAGWAAASTTTREPVGPQAVDETGAQRLRDRRDATAARLAQVLAQPWPERLVGLALLASGQRLVYDHGESPPRPYPTADAGTLADALEWQRRARGFAERGFTLADLRTLPEAMLVGNLLLMGAAALAWRGRAGRLLLLAAAGLAAGAGALLLTDLALTGPPGLRHLVERQFLRLPIGDGAWPLVGVLALGPVSVRVWMPWVAAAVGVLALGLLRHGNGRVLAPLRAWIGACTRPLGDALPMAVLLGAGAAAVWALGLPAAVSEVLIGLAVLGLASYLAREAPIANAGAGLQPAGIGVVVVAVACGVGGSLLRGDLGHALVALLFAAVFFGLFGSRWMRWAVVAGAALAVSVLAASLLQQAPIGPLAWVVDHLLPPHAQERVQALFDPFHADASDLARVRWLLASAGTLGWGPGYVPWQGLAPARVHDGLPLQGPSDYVLALVGALWGRWGGLAVLGATLATFVGAAAIGLRTALRPGLLPPLRLLAGIGGFGCAVMALKAVLSVGGAAALLPLTGLPVALIGYGPVTQGAAWAYLLLALGTAPSPGTPPARGVVMHARPTADGAVRRRGLRLGTMAAVLVVALCVAAERRLAADAEGLPQRHFSEARRELGDAVADALRAVTTGAEPVLDEELPCAALEAVVAVWNASLQDAARDDAAVPRYRLDGSALVERLQASEPRTCRHLARRMGRLLDGGVGRVVDGTAGPRGTATAVSDASRLAAFEPARAPGVRPADYATMNAWWGRPGCVQLDAAGCGSDRAATPEVPMDLWLQRELVPRLASATREPVGSMRLNGRDVPVGPTIDLTLDPAMQAMAQRIADCYTGRLRGDVCADTWPTDARHRSQHFDAADALRAGALGLVAVEVRSGRVLAMAGAVSDCTLDHLARRGDASSGTPRAALRAGQRCAQWPDRRSAFLAHQHPATWLVPPGSSLKPLAVLAGIDAGLVPASADAAWKRVLAESVERLPVQRLALAVAPRYLGVLEQAGWGGGGTIEPMWGRAPPKAPLPYASGWPIAAFDGMQGLRPARMTLDEAERIRAEKAAGAPVDLRYGRAVMGEFVAARRLADAAVGGGDLRVSALGLAGVWRAIELQAEGSAVAPALHLANRPDRATPVQALGWTSAGAASRVQGLTSGVTASAWHGTAQGSCRVVFGQCPREGLEGVSGKTGTSDFLVREGGTEVKAGLQVPAKLFGGVYTDGQGRRIAVGVMALRVRDGVSRTLELTSSSAAEAALTLMRQSGLRMHD